MVEKITGYRTLSDDEIANINAIKEIEKTINGLLDSAVDIDNGRHVSIARTHLETGFMFAVKAIAKPTQ